MSSLMTLQTAGTTPAAVKLNQKIVALDEMLASHIRAGLQSPDLDPGTPVSKLTAALREAETTARANWRAPLIDAVAFLNDLPTLYTAAADEAASIADKLKASIEKYMG